MNIARLYAAWIFLSAMPCISAAAVKAYGIDFSPYMNGQDPNLGVQISESQILSRMQIVSPYTTWVRSFSSSNGLENIPAVARQMGLKVAANAWISSDSAQNTIEINNLITAANAGLVDIAIVGSEAILRRDVTADQLIAYMSQVRQAIPANIPVTTADVYGTFLANPSLIAASDVVFANFYPYWESTSINNAACSLEREYQQLVNASGSKQVVISETGWPSAGNAVGAAVPSQANADLFAQQFLSWAAANAIPSFYFEAFDEAWKANYEGPRGSHWGIWDATGAIKTGMDAFFNGGSTSVTCDDPIPGDPGIIPVYVPPYGSTDLLEARVTGVQPTHYAVAAYIEVAGNWWTKPTFAQPTVSINSDGTVRIPIDTGGNDPTATNIALFLIPSNVVPPVAGPSPLPTIPSAVAMVEVSRTQNSISGTILSNQGIPIAGATVSDPALGTAVSGPDGKYSFYNITTAGNATLTVTYPNYVFPASPYSLPIPTGSELVNFTGTPMVDLSVTAGVSPVQPLVGSNVVETVVVSNAGIAATSDSMMSVPLPASFTLVSVAATRGSCTAISLPIQCDLGPLEPTAFATITVLAKPAIPGQFMLLASVSGPDPDSNPLNNSVSNAVTVSSGLPSVHIDLPVGGTTASGIITVNGWAIDSTTGIGSAIRSVQIQVDGANIGKATYGLHRPDVCTIYPGRLGCPYVGFSYSLNTATLSPGSHKITAIATDSDPTPEAGTTSVTVIVARLPSVHIDSPIGGTAVSGIVTVSGWAINNTTGIGSAVRSVQIQADGVNIGTATYGLRRPDVCTAYPGRPGCPYVGFSYSLNVATLSVGSHTITAIATDSDPPPDTGTAKVTVIVARLPSVHIDSPSSGTTVSGIVTVSGWAINNTTGTGSAIRSVQIQVDGVNAGTAAYGLHRPDVCTAYPGRLGCPYIGFSFSLNTATLSAGSHTITAIAADSDPPPNTGTASVAVSASSH